MPHGAAGHSHSGILLTTCCCCTGCSFPQALRWYVETFSSLRVDTNVWQAVRQDAIQRRLALQGSIAIVVPFVLGALFRWFGVPIYFSYVVLVVAQGVAVVAGVVFGVVGGVAGGVAGEAVLFVAGGVVLFVARGRGAWRGGGVVPRWGGVALGVARQLGVAGGVVLFVAEGVAAWRSGVMGGVVGAWREAWRKAWREAWRKAWREAWCLAWCLAWRFYVLRHGF